MTAARDTDTIEPVESPESDQIELATDEVEEVRERERLRAPVIFEIIRREGEEELTRPATALFYSGLAAGIAIGFSLLSEAVLHAYLPDMPSRHLIESFGYTVGFLTVILARMQLFTENTLTVVLPLLMKPNRASLARTARLWGIVLGANVIGCFLFAAALLIPGVLSPAVLEACLSVSEHMMENSPWQMFIKGIFAGWLIATLVWLLPTADEAKFWAIGLMTYLIAAGDFTHIVAGSAEGFLLVLHGDISIGHMILAFFLPTLLGNVVGGTGLFAALTYAQVSDEIRPWSRFK